MNLNSSYCVGWRLFSLYGMGKKPELGLMNQDLAPESKPPQQRLCVMSFLEVFDLRQRPSETA